MGLMGKMGAIFVGFIPFQIAKLRPPNRRVAVSILAVLLVCLVLSCAVQSEHSGVPRVPKAKGCVLPLMRLQSFCEDGVS